MELLDNIYKHCPYCGLEGSIKQFLGWEKNGAIGFLGKTQEGSIMILCPKCKNHIRYDLSENKFSRINDILPNKKDNYVAFIYGLLSFVLSILFFLRLPGWFKILSIFAFGFCLFFIKKGLSSYSDTNIEKMILPNILSDNDKKNHYKD
jgi:hypothetical protein